MWDKNGNISGRALLVMLTCTGLTVGYIVVSLYQVLAGWAQ